MYVLEGVNSSNTGTTPRIANVTISGSGISDKTITVTQDYFHTSHGFTEVFSSSSSASNRRAMPVTFNETGEIQSISIYHNGGSGNVLLGVYSDQLGKPSSLLGVTGLTEVNPAAGWQTVYLSSPVTVTIGQTVWLAWVFQNSIGVRYTAGTPGRAMSSQTWSSGMPDNYGASGVSNYKFYQDVCR